MSLFVLSAQFGAVQSCTVHFIREETLKKIVLNQIFQITAMMYDNADEFFNLVAKQQLDEQEKEIQTKKKQIGRAHV